MRTAAACERRREGADNEEKKRSSTWFHAEHTELPAAYVFRTASGVSTGAGGDVEKRRSFRKCCRTFARGYGCRITDQQREPHRRAASPRIPQARAMLGESTNNQDRATTNASQDRQTRSPGTGAGNNPGRFRAGACGSPSGCTHGGAHHSRSSRRHTQGAPNVPASPAPWPPPLAAPATTQSRGARRRASPPNSPTPSRSWPTRRPYAFAERPQAAPPRLLRRPSARPAGTRRQAGRCRPPWPGGWRRPPPPPVPRGRPAP